jgi:hypothetical protein
MMGAIPGSREPNPCSTGSGPSGFDPERLLALADRYEKGTGQDRELDAELGELIGFEVHRRDAPFMTTCRRNPSVTLADAECVVPVTMEWGCQRVRPNGYYAWLELASDPVLGPTYDAAAATVERALTAAALRARHAIAMETRRAETGNTDSVAKP